MRVDEPASLTRELQRLARVPLLSEDDVREEFLTPLLRLLGYDHARNEIRRGHSLPTPYRSGTKRKEYIVPDYLTLAEGVHHLALDAKAPDPDDDRSRAVVTNEAYIGQVHSYASHRSVRAPYFVISNGRFTAVYESDSDTSNPVLLFSQSGVERGFCALKDVIGKPRVSAQLAARLPISWTVDRVHTATGFQPMNIDVGDVNHDGLNEIVVALSENRITSFSHRGAIDREFPTDGWVWWVKCTGSIEFGHATVVALQHNRGSLDTGGRVLGVGPGVKWNYPLDRAGSGFERLDRIVIHGRTATAIVGVPCADHVLAFDLGGELRWSVDSFAPGDVSSSSTMHLCINRDSVVVTASRGGTGVIAQLSVETGQVEAVVPLPFRGGQIVPLETKGQRLVVGSCDRGDFAVVDMSTESLVRVFKDVASVGNAPLAYSAVHDVVVVGDMSRLAAYRCGALDAGFLELMWSSSDVAGLPSALEWAVLNDEDVLVAGTVGSAVAPGLNGLYILSEEGRLRRRYLIDGEQAGGVAIAAEVATPAGIRDLAVVDLDADGRHEIVAAADDARLYVWKP